MNPENKTPEKDIAEYQSKLVESQNQANQLAQWRKNTAVDSDTYIIKTQMLTNLENEIKESNFKNNPIAVNDTHFAIAIGGMSLLIGKLSLKSHKVVNLLNLLGKMGDGITITHVALSNCFLQNYMIIITSGLQLLIFVLKPTEDDDNIIRFPLRVCNKCDPSIYQWKHNRFFYSIDNEIHTLTFQELPSNDVSSISNDELAECCDYKKTIDINDRIDYFDVSKVQGLFYIYSNERIFIYDEENRIQYIYKVGGKDEKVICIRSLGRESETQQNSEGKAVALQDYVIVVTDKNKIYVHDVNKMKGTTTEDQARVAIFDLKRFNIGEGILEIDSILCNKDGSHIIAISTSQRVGLCFSVGDFYLSDNTSDSNKGNVVFPFFESFFSLSLPEGYLKSTLLTGDQLLKLFKSMEWKDPGQLLFTLSLQSSNKFAIHAIPLEPLHAIDNLQNNADEVKLDEIKKESASLGNVADISVTTNLDDLQAQFNQFTNDANKLSQDDPTSQTNRVSGFLDLAEVEKQMMEKAVEQKQEHKKSFKEKLIQKKEEQKQSKPLEEPTKQKVKKVKAEPEQFVKNLSELFVGFHEQLSKKVSKIVDEGRKGAAKELQAALMTAAKELKKSYNEEMLKNNEKVLIPYFEKCVFKIFEKYSSSLEKTYNLYTDKIESEVNNNKKIGTSLDTIFSAHITTANKIQQSLDMFMTNINKLVDQQEKPTNDRLMIILETIANNQSIMNNNLNDLSHRINNIERGLQHVIQRSESPRYVKPIYDVRMPHLNTATTGYQINTDSFSQQQKPELNPSNIGLNQKLSTSVEDAPVYYTKMEAYLRDVITKPSDNTDKKDIEGEKILTPVLKNPFSFKMMYADTMQPKKL